jgi:histidinol-phosphate aminotransferase
MRKYNFASQIARLPVVDPGLTRPDWSKIAPRDASLLWLDKNENIDPELAALTTQILSELDPKALFSYPDNGPLYQKLSDFLGVGNDHLLLSAGSDGVIRSVFEAFVNPGDVVVHTVPTFAMYGVYCQIYGARTVRLEYAPSNQGPLLPLAKVLQTIAQTRPKLVCLPNPDSPTGTVFPPEELRQIIAATGDAGALILIDEAYHPFYEETVLPWVDAYGHLVVARTFAKAWGLAGLRIGYGVAAPEVARLLHKVRPMYEVNTLAIVFMERMLDFVAEMLASVRRLNLGRDTFLSAMESMGFKTVHAQGNFLHVALGAKAPAIHAALKSMVLYRVDFNEPCLKGYSRFSSATREMFDPVIHAIRRAVMTAG